jgi:hypothetical protein
MLRNFFGHEKRPAKVAFSAPIPSKNKQPPSKEDGCLREKILPLIQQSTSGW